jgi:hypothetical protein
VQSDLRREKKAWSENRGQGGIRWVDDIDAPTARTRFASVQANVWPWNRDKQESDTSTPYDGDKEPDDVPTGAPDEVPKSAASGASSSHVTDETHVGALHDAPDAGPSVEKSPV